MLADLLGSRLRARLLTWLVLHPDEEFYVRELATRLGEDSTNVSRELARLARLGIVTARTEGRQKYVRIDTSSPVFPELRGLAVKTEGVAGALESALAPLASRIEVAFVYGSLAAGAPKPGSDVDLMVIGDVTFAEVTQALHGAETTLGREVNPSVYSLPEVRRKLRGGHHFLSSVAREPKIFVIGDQGEFARLGS